MAQIDWLAWNCGAKNDSLSVFCQTRGVPRGGFRMDFTHQLKHSEIEAKGLQNLESVMEQDIF